MNQLPVTIRRAYLSDLPAIVDIYNQAIEDRVATCDLSGFTAEQKLIWFNEHKQDPYPLWVAEHDHVIVGWTVLFPYDAKLCFSQTAMFSTYVRREAQGQKIGTSLREHLIRSARELGFHTIVNRVWAPNERSISLARKFGFIEVGRMREIVCIEGRFIDCVFFQLML